MKSFTRAAALAVALSSISTGASAQAALDIDVSFEFPGVIILRCVDAIDVSISAADVLTIAGVPAAENTTDVIDETGANVSAGAIDIDGGAISVPGAGTDLTFDATISGVCAIRSIGTAGGTNTITLTRAGGTLTGAASAGVITVDEVSVRTGGTSPGAAGAGTFATASTPTGTATVQFPTAGFSTLQYVDVQMALDLSTADEAGDFSATGLFTISVAAP